MAQLSSGDFLIVVGQVIAQFSPAGVLRPTVTGGTLVGASTGGTTLFQPDGKYLIAQSAAGEAGENDIDMQVPRFSSTGGVDFGFSNPPFDVARLNSTGSLDTSFGSGGRVATAIPNSQAAADDVTVQADGKIVVIGQAIVNFTGTVKLVIARYLGQ